MKKEQKIKVLRKKPGQPVEVVKIENSLKSLQAEVGGYIETCTFATDACVICNEEGRLLGLPDNCEFLSQVFVGTILAVGVKGEEFCSLSNKGILMIKACIRDLS